MMTVNEYAEQVSEVFVLSDSFLRIKELIDDEASTIDDISDVIIVDPALASTILKLANSSFFNYPGKIDTISKALLVLGITEVYNLVIAYFTQRAFKEANADRAYLDDFWRKSVDCALLIKFFGTSLNIVNAERLFILGLLHNLGELVVQKITPEKISECSSNSLDILPWDKQRAILSFSFGECSAELLKQWQLPYSLIGPIRNQDKEDIAQYTKEAQLLFVAKRIMNSNSVIKQVTYDSLIAEEVLVDLNINKSLINEAIVYCDVERLGILSVLNP